MKQISVAISDELKEKLMELAQEEGRSVAGVVREILKNYFKD